MPPNNYQPNLPKKRKFIIVIAVIAMILIAIFIVGFSSKSAELTVDTNGNNSIIIKRLDVSSITAFSAQKTGSSFSIKLTSGLYSVTVSNKQSSAQRTVTIKAGKNQQLTINLVAFGQMEPVTDENINYLSANSSKLTFLAASGSLVTIDAQNNEHKLSSQKFSSVSWASTDYGVAQDASGGLYIINNGSVNQISNSLIPVSDSSISNNYTLAPNKMLYVSDGQNLFAGTAGTALAKLYSSSSGKISISSATNGKVLIQLSSDNNPTSKNNSNLVIVSDSGSSVKSTGDIYDSAWSADGKYLVTSSDQASTVYDAQLNIVDRLPSNNVISPMWAGDNLFYGLAGGLWEYNLDNQTANQVADISLFGYVSSIVPSQDGAFIYVRVQNTNSSQPTFQLVRFGLQNQAVSQLAVALQVLLPNTISGCQIGYINFNNPTITVSNSSCTSVAQSYLSQDGQNPGQFSYTTQTYN